jgi:hypothetical protein
MLGRYVRSFNSHWVKARKHYQVRYRLDGVVSYLIWYTNESDGVVVGGDGRVLSFPARPDMLADAGRWGLAFEDEEPSDFDLDAVALWLSTQDGAAIDCRLFVTSRRRQASYRGCLTRIVIRLPVRLTRPWFRSATMPSTG